MKLETTIQLIMSAEDYNNIKTDLKRILSEISAQQMASYEDTLKQFPGIANLLEIMSYGKIDDIFDVSREQVENPNIDDALTVASNLENNF